MTPRHPVPTLLLVLTCCATPHRQFREGTAGAVPAPPGIVVAPQGLGPVAPTGLRLPDTLKSLAQRVELTIVPSSPSFEGTTELDVELATATDVVWLNVRALTVKTASARVGNAESSAQLFPSPERVALRFPRAIGPGRATLRLAFSGVLSSTEDAGVFHQQEGGDWYAMTQFEETDARRAFPCVDEPSSKIPWELTLRVPKDMVAVSNSPISSTEAAGEGMKRVHFAPTKPLPSYLVAFGVGPYDFVDARPAGVNKIPMRVYVPKGRAAEAAYAARTSPEILETLEAYFGVPYPYEKLDMLAIPLTVHFGAMENAGLVTVASAQLLARKENETLKFQRTWGIYAAHEFAHQWFGDLVTLAWWNDIWLNEAFATWMENNVLVSWAPSWGMDVVEVADRSEAANADTLLTARSIRQPIETYDDINNAFDGITYQKGAAIIRMFETYLGKDKFQKGVQNYLRAHAYGNATAPDFLAAISEAAGSDVAPAFDTFLDQSGVPQLTVQLVCGRGKTPELQLAQERLLPLGTTTADDRRWQVPVCARWSTGGKGHQACTLMTSKSTTLPLEGKGCPEWVLPNAAYAGYYRLNLKGNLLKTLVTRGRAALHPRRDGGASRRRRRPGERWPLPRSRRNGARHALQRLERPADGGGGHRAGHGPPGVPRGDDGEGLPGLGTETFRPTCAGPRNAGTQGRERGHPSLATVAGELRGPAWRGPDAHRGGTVHDRALAEGPGLRGPGHGEHRSRHRRQFRGRDAAHCVGGAGEVEPDRATRTRLLTALAAFRDPAMVKANLALLEAAPIDPRELVRLLYGTLHYPGAADLAFHEVSEHFDLLASREPERTVTNLFLAGVAFCDAKHRAAVEAAFGPRAEKVLGGKRVLAQTLETIDLCIANRAVQVPSITPYLAASPRRGRGSAAAGQP